MIEFLLMMTVMSYPMSFIMELIYELRLYKFLADCGYKVNFNNCKQIKEDITEEDYDKVNPAFIPFLNVYNVLKRGLDLAYLDNFVLEEYERRGIIERMTKEEREAYSKNNTGLEALIIGIKRTDKDFRKYIVELNFEDEKIEVLIQYNIPLDKIRVLKVKGHKKIDLSICSDDILKVIHERLGIKEELKVSENNDEKNREYNKRIEDLKKQKEYYESLINILNKRRESIINSDNKKEVNFEIENEKDKTLTK